MREKDFRAWDKKSKQMVHSSDDGGMFGESVIIAVGENRVYLLDSEPYVSEKPDFVPMQYIGLKDKNKVKIYEDDRVKQVDEHGNEDIGVVSYEPSIAGYVLRWKQHEGWVKLSPEDELEVIGNVHSNKELINSKE